MSTETKYIIVDDDPLNNTICSLMLKRTLHEVGIKTFTQPWEGLVFIQNNINRLMTHSVLFLDINMPALTGWDFLGHYEKFSEEIKMQISIYLLSSSINQRDRDKAKKYECIKGFVSKPLTTEAILTIAGNEF
jgi:two-component SAPR family response regulator